MDGSARTAGNIEDAPVSTTKNNQELRILEAMLFAATEPVPEAVLIERMPNGSDVAALLLELSTQYRDRGINLIQVSGRWVFRTALDLRESLKIEVNVSRKLSRAWVETLAIIAYHQPITRGEIEEIRGVMLSKGTLDVLLEVGWIRPVGRRRTPGRPATWGTTAKFLDHFNLNELIDLPGVSELKAAGLLDTRPTKTIFGEAVADNASSETNSHNKEMAEPLDPNDGSLNKESSIP